jgi:hypothetical protein
MKVKTGSARHRVWNCPWFSVAVTQAWRGGPWRGRGWGVGQRSDHGGLGKLSYVIWVYTWNVWGVFEAFRAGWVTWPGLLFQAAMKIYVRGPDLLLWTHTIQCPRPPREEKTELWELKLSNNLTLGLLGLGDGTWAGILTWRLIT